MTRIENEPKAAAKNNKSLKFWKTMNILYERLITVILIVALLIVSWCMYDNYYVFSNTIDNKLLDYKPGKNSPSEAQKRMPMSDDYAAWITIDDTGIDYPVMQGSDNTVYLNTDPFGKYSLSGSIFLDSRNSKDFTDNYSLIYGHHMEYGKMFGALDKFLDRNYMLEHRTGTLIIGKEAEKTCDLTVFAAMTVKADEKTVFDPTKGGAAQYILEKAEVMIEPAVTDARIIALSTCVDANSIRRMVVFCYVTDEASGE